MNLNNLLKKATLCTTIFLASCSSNPTFKGGALNAGETPKNLVPVATIVVNNKNQINSKLYKLIEQKIEDGKNPLEEISNRIKTISDADKKTKKELELINETFVIKDYLTSKDVISKFANRFYKGDLNAAKEAIDEYSPKIYKSRGLVNHLLGNYDAAIEDCNKGMASTTDLKVKSDILSLRGFAKNFKKDIDGASLDFLIGAGMDKEDSWNLYSKALILKRVGRYKESMRDYHYSIKRDPNNLTSIIEMAELETQLLKSNQSELLKNNIPGLRIESVEELLSLALKLKYKENENKIIYDSEIINKSDEIKRLSKLILQQEGKLTYFIKKTKSENDDKNEKELVRILLNYVIEKNSEDQEAYGLRGVANLGLEKYKEAKEDFTKARSILNKNDIKLPEIKEIQTTNFNVLEYAVIDRETNSIILSGKMDSNYPTGAIPYYDLLQTALKSINQGGPSFSLDPTEETLELSKKIKMIIKQPELSFVSTMSTIQKLEGEIGIIFSLMTSDPIDEFGGLTINGSHCPDMNNKVLPLAEMLDLKEEINLILDEKGTKEVHERAFDKLFGTQSYEKVRNALKNKDRKELEKIQDELGKGFSRKLGLSEKIYSKFKEASVIKDEQERNQRLMQIMSTLTLNDATNKRELIISKELCNIMYGTPTAKLRFEKIEDDSQLARILFQSDYDLKKIVQEHKIKEIDNHMSQLQWVLKNDKDFLAKGELNVRYWISLSNLDINNTNDRSIIQFDKAKMKIEARRRESLDITNSNETIDPTISSYARYITEKYDEYAKIFPSLHEVEESSKIVALANLLKENRLDLKFNSPIIKWIAPKTVEGGIDIYKPKGDTGSGYTGISGGVDLSKVRESTTIKLNKDIPIPPKLDHRFRLGDTTRILHSKGEGPLTAASRTELLNKEKEKLERVIAQGRKQIEEISKGIQPQRKNLDELVKKEQDAAFEWRLTATQLFAETTAGSKLIKNASPKLIKTKEDFDALGKLSTVINTIATSRSMANKEVTNQSEEAFEEAYSYLRDATLSNINDALSDPDLRGIKKAEKWESSGNKIFQAYSFIQGAKDSIEAMTEYLEQKREVNGLLDDNITQTEFAKRLQEVNEKNVKKLKEVNQALESK